MALPQPNDDPIQKLVQWATERSAIRAVLMTSTRSIPNGCTDALSDYDIILIVQDIHPFVADHCWLNDFGEVLVAYWDPIFPNSVFGHDECGNVIQYVDGLKIDFTLWPVELFQQIVAAPGLPAELDAGYRVLLDKDQLTAPMLRPTFIAYVPKPPTLTVYQTVINDFLSGAPYVAKCLWRDELLPAKACLDADMKQVYLRQVFEWRVAMDHDWAISTGALGKGLKKRLSKDIWTAFEQTCVGARLADNWESLAHTLALFRRVAMEVGVHLGYAYPDELHERVRVYVEQIKRLPPTDTNSCEQAG